MTEFLKTFITNSLSLLRDKETKRFYRHLISHPKSSLSCLRLSGHFTRDRGPRYTCVSSLTYPLYRTQGDKGVSKNELVTSRVLSKFSFSL